MGKGLKPPATGAGKVTPKIDAVDKSSGFQKRRSLAMLYTTKFDSITPRTCPNMDGTMMRHSESPKSAITIVKTGLSFDSGAVKSPSEYEMPMRMARYRVGVGKLNVCCMKCVL